MPAKMSTRAVIASRRSTLNPGKRTAASRSVLKRCGRCYCRAMKPLRSVPLLLVPLLLASGCASRIDPNAYQSLDCAELNQAVTQTSKQISTTAITLSNVDSYSVPIWAPGAGRVKQAIVDRNTRKLSELRGVQDQVVAERKRRCS